MIENGHFKSMEMAMNDPGQFGQIPDRQTIRRLKHKIRLEAEHSSPYQPRQFLEGLIIALGLGSLYEIGRSSSMAANSERVAQNNSQESSSQSQEAQPPQPLPPPPARDSSRSRTDEVYGAGGSRWKKIRRGRQGF